MFRYIALAWNHASVEANAIAQELWQRISGTSAQWRTVEEFPGLLVSCADESAEATDVHVLPGRSGVVLGALFRRANVSGYEPSDRLFALGENDAETIRRSNGRILISNFWGSYVAILRDSLSGETRIIKDPTGNLPCFLFHHKGVSIVFSCLEDLLKARISRLTVNQAYLRSRIASGGIDARYDAINEITQVRRGECVLLKNAASGQSGQSHRQFYWSPLAFADSDTAIEDPEEAAEALRAATQECVNAWTIRHPRYLLRLSGGLDSSIVLGCAAKAQRGRRPVTYTYYNPRGSSDERRWAQLAARHSNSHHVEHPFDPSAIRLERMLEMAASVEPVSAISYLERGRAERDIGAPTSATAVFSGDGGDSGFGSENAGLALDAFWRRCGLRPRALQLAAEVATLRESTVFEVFRGAIRRRVRGSTMKDHIDLVLEGRTLISDDIRRENFRYSTYPHPWFSEIEDVPWDPIYRVGVLTYMPEFYDPFTNPDEPGLDPVAPLYSQPVVETCLRIPLDVHFYQGHDRGLARKAFSTELPDLIRRRRWKDRAPGYFEELMHQNRSFFRETLGDGILVKDHLLDRVAVDTALRGNVTNYEFPVGEFFNHMDVEIWLRRLSASSQSNEA